MQFISLQIFFFHENGTSNITTAINSKRPNSIVMDKIHLAASGSGANVLSGPMSGPKPGPTLAMAVKAPDRLVIKSNPKKDKAKVHSRTAHLSLDRGNLQQ